MREYQLILKFRGRVTVPLNEIVVRAQHALERLGVFDLSLIERYHLRRCAEFCAANAESQWRRVRFNPRHLPVIPNPGEEAAWMWLIEAYGLDSDTLKRDIYHYGYLSGYTLKWLCVQRVKSHHPCYEEPTQRFKNFPPFAL